MDGVTRVMTRFITQLNVASTKRGYLPGGSRNIDEDATDVDDVAAPLQPKDTEGGLC